MEFAAAAISNVVGIVVLCLFAAGVMKLFQIATTLTEIKDLLQADKRQATFEPKAPLTPSGEEMLRVLDQEMRLTSDPEGINPEIVNPR